MSLRITWKFAYRAADLVGSAFAQVCHHRERLSYWEAQQNEAEGQAREKGLLIHDMPVTGGRQVQMVVDPTFQHRLNECASKIDEHRREAESFAMFHRAFELNPDAELLLDAEDLRYFGL